MTRGNGQNLERLSKVCSLRHHDINHFPEIYFSNSVCCFPLFDTFRQHIQSSVFVIWVTRLNVHHICHAAAINNIKKDLHASYHQLSWTLSIYALVQGASPIIWSAFTELYGRKVNHF